MANKALIQSGGDGTAVPSGAVGEERKQSMTISLATGFTNAVAKNITTNPIVLDAGTWEMSAHGYINAGTGDTVQQCIFAISTVSATIPAAADTHSVPDVSGQIKVIWTGSMLNNGQSVAISPYRVTVTSPTTYYFVGHAGHSGGTCALHGIYRAIRIA
jgi:hypothetical protein